MTSLHKQILALCAVVCAICITLLLAWFSWQAIASSLQPRTATADATGKQAAPDNAKGDDAQGNAAAPPRLPRRNDHRAHAVVVIADEEMAKARLLERNQDDDSIGQDVDAGNAESERDRSESDHNQQLRPQPPAPFPARPGMDYATGNPLFELSDEEKNRIWWEIADASQRRGDVAFTYTLTSEAAGPIATKYGVSVLQIFEFFRAGVDSSWLEHELSGLPIEDITDEETGDSG